MAITNQPAEDSLYSAYSQIPVETDNSTPGLEIKTQNFDEDNMVPLHLPLLCFKEPVRAILPL